METQAHRQETQATAEGPVCVKAGVSALKSLILLNKGLSFRSALGREMYLVLGPLCAKSPLHQVPQQSMITKGPRGKTLLRQYD